MQQILFVSGDISYEYKGYDMWYGENIWKSNAHQNIFEVAGDRGMISLSQGKS